MQELLGNDYNRGVVDPKNYRRSYLYGVAQEPL